VPFALHSLTNPIAVVVLIAMGRSPSCSALQTAAGIYQNIRYNSEMQRLLSASRETCRAGAYKLLETPSGEFWEPSSNK
jgi:hypothetical protein